MKNSMLMLTAGLSAFSLLAVCADVQANPKRECAMAYENTQSFREHGKLIDARKQAVACSASTCSEYVINDCMQWLAEIDAILPTVVFMAVDAAGAETAAVRVSVDGELLVEKLDGKAVTVDPGEHTVRYEMAGIEALEQKVLIRQAEKNRIVAASFRKEPAVLPRNTPPAGSFLNGYRIGAIAAGVVGLAGIGVGGGFGAVTYSKWGEALSYCMNRDPRYCKEEGITLGNEARASASVSDVSFIVGGVGVGASVLLWILAAKSMPAAKGESGVRVTPVVGQSGLGTVIEGSF